MSRAPEPTRAYPIRPVPLWQPTPEPTLAPVPESAPAAAVAASPLPPRPRPPRVEEWLGFKFFLALSPRLKSQPQPAVPQDLGPFEAVRLQRSRGLPALSATWYPSKAERVRGVVLLLPPWTVWGQAYFLRRGRIQALQAAGYHAFTLDLPGFGASHKAGDFFDRDVEDALLALRERCPGLPVLVWGVSAGGYWAHPALARHPWVSGAFFEDVAPHLFEWGWRMSPWGRPFFLFFRGFLPQAYSFLDLRLHVPSLWGRSLTYVSGVCDPGIPVEDAAELARLAGAAYLAVPRAGHLASIKMATSEVIAMALATFEDALAQPRQKQQRRCALPIH